MDVQPSIYIKTRPRTVFDLDKFVRERCRAKGVPLEGPTEKTHQQPPKPIVTLPGQSIVYPTMEEHQTAPSVNIVINEAEGAKGVTASNSSGDWAKEYIRVTKEMEGLKKQLDDANENVEVFKKMLAHTAASMDKWKRHEGMTELEANAQINKMLQHTSELNDQLKHSQQVQEDIKRRLSTNQKESQQLREYMEKERHARVETDAKLESVEHQLEQVKSSLDKYRTAYVEAARKYIHDKDDDQVRAIAEKYRHDVAQNTKADETLKRMNIQAAEILDLLLQQRRLSDQFSTVPKQHQKQNPKPHQKQNPNPPSHSPQTHDQ